MLTRSLKLLEFNWHNVVLITIWIIDGFHFKELVCLILDHFTLFRMTQRDPCPCLTRSGLMSWCHLRSVRCHWNVASWIKIFPVIQRTKSISGKVNKSGVILDRKSRVMRDHKGCSTEYSSPLNFPPLQSAVTRANSLIPPSSCHYAQQTFCVLCMSDLSRQICSDIISTALLSIYFHVSAGLHCSNKLGIYEWMRLTILWLLSFDEQFTLVIRTDGRVWPDI